MIYNEETKQFERKSRPELPMDIIQRIAAFAPYINDVELECGDVFSGARVYFINGSDDIDYYNFTGSYDTATGAITTSMQQAIAFAKLITGPIMIIPEDWRDYCSWISYDPDQIIEAIAEESDEDGTYVWYLDESTYYRLNSIQDIIDCSGYDQSQELAEFAAIHAWWIA